MVYILEDCKLNFQVILETQKIKKIIAWRELLRANIIFEPKKVVNEHEKFAFGTQEFKYFPSRHTLNKNLLTNNFANRNGNLYLPYVDVGKDVILQAGSQCELK